MTAAEVIHELGGSGVVAAALHLSGSGVSNWKRRGVPRSRIIDVYELALANKASLTLQNIKAAARQPHARRPPVIQVTG